MLTGAEWTPNSASLSLRLDLDRLCWCSQGRQLGATLRLRPTSCTEEHAMAGYVQASLQPGETVDYRGRVARIALLARPLFMLLIAIVGLGLIGSHDNHNNPNAALGILSVLLVLDLILAVIGLVANYVFYKGAEYAVTDRRVIGKYGVIRRRAVEVLMTQISGVTVSQSVPGRIFRY